MINNISTPYLKLFTIAKLSNIFIKTNTYICTELRNLFNSIILFKYVRLRKFIKIGRITKTVQNVTQNKACRIMQSKTIVSTYLQNRSKECKGALDY